MCYLNTVPLPNSAEVIFQFEINHASLPAHLLELQAFQLTYICLLFINAANIYLALSGGHYFMN